MRAAYLFVLVSILVFSALAFRRLPASAAGAPVPAVAAAPPPVLIELFTSEGCSDCPPADALLQKLDRSSPFAGSTIVVLSEHVDYWNDLGWRDPYSSHQLSERQAAYAARFRLDSVYTPQMVVDGRFQLVGSDESRAISSIEAASKDQKTRIALSSLRPARPNTLDLHLDVDPLPASAPANSADVWIAVADDSDVSSVARGENGGRTLYHVAVLRSLSRVGAVGRTAAFSRDVTLALDPGGARNLRIVAVVQESGQGKVWGVAFSRFSR
jgi:hypothetical protein